MGNFIYDIKHYGLKIAMDNLLIISLKRYLRAKRIVITYGRK